MPTTTTTTTTSPTPIVFGVLLLGAGVQLLDVSPVDIFGMLDPAYLRACQLPENVVAQGVDVEFHYITESDEALHPMTAGAKIGVTDSIHTSPRLTHLLLPGPPPTYTPSPAITHFLTTQLPHLTAFMTVCTGVMPALASGILDGKTVTAPRGLIPMLREKYPGSEFVEKRWVRDGKVWTSGGVTNGLDMMAGFLREGFQRGKKREVVEVVLGLADVGDRGQEYRD
ncbi:MAG: hypothetical protein M1830_000541 [Pleopsidium flavum]|nr:MAG: hypothetical protein M1830_000541 [Pleopsidium flavum]